MSRHDRRRMLIHGVLLLSHLSLAEATSSTVCWKDTPCDAAFTETAFPGPWEAGILAPASRTVMPKSIVQVDLSSSREAPLSRLPFDRLTTILRGNGSQVVFDFGQEVGGLVTLRYSARHSRGACGDDIDNRCSSRPGSTLGLAFTESSDFIGQWSDASNGAFQKPDGAIYAEVNHDDDEKTYTMPDQSLRGGFRYLTVFLVTDPEDDDSYTTVALHNVSLDLAFQPTWPNLRAYQGYFDCDDPLLNRIWYSGAYTLQTNAVPPNTGRRVPFMAQGGWANDGLLGPGHTILVDGAKRDRAVWPGDMGVAMPSIFVSTGDMESVKNALQTIYDNQNPDGSFPEAGPPLLQQGSDTYHMWTMIGTYTYVLYTNDTAFLTRNWAGYRRAMAFITAKQGQGQTDGDKGLLFVTGVRDWARLNVGANMTEAQVILYRTLTTGTDLASWLSPTSQSTAEAEAAAWAAAAERLRHATLEHCYDAHAGLFRDNAAPSAPSAAAVYPQDANALALALGMVGGRLAATVSDRLLRNWVSSADPYPVAPELPGHVSPFITSWEVRGHLAAGKTDRALALVRAVWGRYIDRPDGSQSTMVEGLLVSPQEEENRLGFGYRWNRGYGGAHNETSVAAAYTSHSHGWSAGPTSALTEFVLGLSVTGLAGSAWRFAPQLARSGPHRAQGGFVTALGHFQASWVRHGCALANGQQTCGENSTSFEATVNTPIGTSGVLVLPTPELPTSKRAFRVVLDGNTIDPRDHAGTGIAVLHVKGGRHVIRVNRE